MSYDSGTGTIAYLDLSEIGQHIQPDGESPSGIEKETKRLPDAPRYFSTLPCAGGLRLCTSAHLTESPSCIVPVYEVKKNHMTTTLSNYDNDLWKYCTKEQIKDMLLSFRLLQGAPVREEKELACLYAVSNHIKKHYHTAQIPKRNGSVRRLLVPDALLNTIQKNLLHHVLDGLSVSVYATAYKKKTTVLDNALSHVGQEQVMKLDIENFFENITFPLVYQSAFPAIYFPPAVRRILAELCCYEDYLPQGAPTSPTVSNLVMKSFDNYMGAWCEERGIHYTRYSDDMTFSGVFDEVELKNKVKNYLLTMGFVLNEKKTKLLGKHTRQTVTGIVVNEKADVGRAYKREVRSEEHTSELQSR